MPANYSRRQLFGAGLGGLGIFLAGGYTWNQYSRRYELQFRPLEVRNESDERVELVVTVRDEAANGDATERTLELEPAGDDDGDDQRRLAGHWIKRASLWTVEAAADGDELELTAEEITERLEESGWGPDTAHVTITVAEDGSLESSVSPRETE